jgi:hypothetical protein
MFMDPEDFQSEYPEWYEMFISMWEGDGCKDDLEYTDDYGDDCAWYAEAENTESCGLFDSESSWTANDACCACKGGSGGTSDDSDLVWEAFLVDPYGSGDWAFVWFEDEDFSEMHYWNEDD